MSIEKVLEENEKIIYSGKAVINKTDKQVWRILLVILVIALFFYLFYLGINSSNNTVIDGVVIFIVLLMFTVLIVYAFIYNVFIMDKSIKCNEYYLTNKRAFVYNSKKKELLIGNINSFTIAIINREKNGYGDLYICKGWDGSGNVLSVVIKEFRPNEDKNDATHINFQGIENPRTVFELVKKINDRISVIDDRPEFMGRKL